MATTHPYLHTMKYAITKKDYEALRNRLANTAVLYTGAAAT